MAFFWKVLTARRMAMTAETVTTAIPMQNSGVLIVPNTFLSINEIGAESGK